ncbi:MAG: SMP-30/gluconolactonase/LRE family protein [Ignavibacteriaceae bacterium]
MRNIYCFVLLLISSYTLAQSPVPPGAKLEKVAGGFSFVEGPVWMDSTGLLFSDIDANTIYKWNVKDSSVSVFMRPSQTSNCLIFDKQGRLVFTQMGLRRIARREKDSTITVLASLYNSKKLNSPNDIVVKSDGSVFFTDPPLNIPAGEKQQLSFSGIFRISSSGSLQIMDSSLNEPNGICFSPDEWKLYVNDTQVNINYDWDVINDSTISNKQKFVYLGNGGYADGMKADPSGNIYSAGPGGIRIFALLDLSYQISEARFKTYTIDLRGHGENEIPYDENIMQDINLLIGFICEPGMKIVIIGHSLRGRLALICECDFSIGISPAINKEFSSQTQQIINNLRTYRVKEKSQGINFEILKCFPGYSAKVENTKIIYGSRDIPEIMNKCKIMMELGYDVAVIENSLHSDIYVNKKTIEIMKDSLSGWFS